jgi:hypothetical protein
VGAAANQIAEDCEKLEENGGRMGFGVGSHGAYGESGETVESAFAQFGIRGGAGRGCARCFRRRPRFWRLGVSFGLRLAQKAEEFVLASLYIGEDGQVGATDGSGCLSCHDSTLLRFRNMSHGGRAFC